MRQIEVFRYERHLSEGATEVLKQMTGLKMLRELVRLAGAAKACTDRTGSQPRQHENCATCLTAYHGLGGF